MATSSTTPPTPRPRIFVSCVTSEFRGARQRVANVLNYLGYDVESEEIFGIEAGDLRQVLRSKIDSCDGFIQIIGDGFGAEPPSPDPIRGRLSYTQFEYHHAFGTRKRIWLFFAGRDCTRDCPVEKLDLPRDPENHDAAAWQTERRELQRNYREKMRQTGSIYYDASNDTELENHILKIRNDSEALRENFRKWQQEITISDTRTAWKLNAISALILLAIAGGILAVGHFNTEIRAPRHVDAPAIRGRLGEASARVFERETESAGREQDPKRKQELLNAANAANGVRNARIDDLVKQFSDIESNKLASDDFNELSRLLQDPHGGVDKALDFLESRRATILRQVEADLNKRRSLLQPILEGAKIAVTNGRNPQAESLFKAVLKADPSWTEARCQYWRFLTEVAGPQAETHESRYVAITIYSEAELQAHRVAVSCDSSDNPGVWRGAQDNWRRSLLKLGDLARNGGASELAVADDYYRQSKQILERISRSDPESLHWHHELGIVYRCLGDVARDQRKWDAAKTFYGKAREIQETPRPGVFEERERQHDLALTYQCIGDVAYGQFTIRSISEAIDAYTKVRQLRENLLDLQPDDLMIKHDLGDSFQRLGEIHQDIGRLESARDYFDRAIVIRDGLVKSSRDEIYWKNELAITLTCLGDIAIKTAEKEIENNGSESTRLLIEAQKHFEDALSIRRSLKQLTQSMGDRLFDQDIATNEFNLGETQLTMRNWEEALKHYDKGLEIRTTLSLLNPKEPAMQNALAWAHRKLGDLQMSRGDPKTEDKGRLEAAETHYLNYLAISKALTEQYPEDPVWIQQYASSLQKVGEFSERRGQVQEAKQQYGDALAEMARIPAKEVMNLNWQIDVAETSYKLACLDGMKGIRMDPTELAAIGTRLAALCEAVNKADLPIGARCGSLMEKFRLRFQKPE